MGRLPKREPLKCHICGGEALIWRHMVLPAGSFKERIANEEKGLPYRTVVCEVVLLVEPGTPVRAIPRTEKKVECIARAEAKGYRTDPKFHKPRRTINAIRNIRRWSTPTRKRNSIFKWKPIRIRPKHINRFINIWTTLFRNIKSIMYIPNKGKDIYINWVQNRNLGLYIFRKKRRKQYKLWKTTSITTSKT